MLRDSQTELTIVSGGQNQSAVGGMSFDDVSIVLVALQHALQHASPAVPHPQEMVAARRDHESVRAVPAHHRHLQLFRLLLGQIIPKTNR